MAAAGVAAGATASCGRATGQDGDETNDEMGAKQAEAAGEGRLTARPGTRGSTTPTPGLQPLADGDDEALLYVPASYDPDRRHQLVLMLHGAGGEARGGLAPLLPLADEAALILLSPKSRGSTWDVIGGGYGRDVAFIDRMLEKTFARTAVDPRRVGIGGFSDGASYALSLGLINGDVFTAVVAFSPGFVAPGERRGSPTIFVSHGVADAVLPIDVTSRRLVPRLRRDGYDVRYREFQGPHAVPAPIAREAVDWLLSHAGAEE